MHDKMLDLVIKVDGGNMYSTLMTIAIVIIFAAVIVFVMKRKGK